MQKSIMKICIAIFSIAITLTTVGCSGGGSSGSSSSVFGGGGGKGPFKQGSTVIAYKLTDGVRVADTNATTTTSDDTGKFSFGTSITWSGATEFLIYGDYLNENTGTYMNLAADKALRAVADAAKGSVFINVLTNIAAPGIIESLKQNVPIATASAQAQENVAKLFNITLDAGVELTDLDVTNTTSNTTANSQLLLISAAILNTANPEQVMQELATDMSDGEVDDSALGALEELKTQAALVDIEKVAAKMEEANIGVTTLDVANVFDGLLAFDHNISFAKVNDAFTSTVYTSNEATVEKVQGTSAAAISVSGGSYSIDGGAFVTTAGTITNGQKVRVRGTSSASYETSTPVTLTIGGGLIVYNIVTQSAPSVVDTTPNKFTFGYKNNQSNNTSVTSDTIKITGINQATPISINYGTFTVNGLVFTTVNNDDNVTVTHTTGALGTQTKSIITIGDVNGTFSSFTVPVDTTPNQFLFAPVNDVNNTSVDGNVTSENITITGINTDTPITVSGGEYSLNNGSNYTASAGVIANNGTVKLRGIRSSEFDTTTVVSVKIGNVIGEFKITTMTNPFVADSTPNAFSFASQLGQEVNTDVDANMTVSGINVAVPVTITNGTYVVNGDSQDANVSNGDVITVTQTTSDAFDTEKVTTLTVGGVSSTFKTKTIIEDKTPDTFSFDTNGSIAVNTEATSNTITIAGLSTGTTLPISIVNGEYDVDVGGYTTVTGTVTNGSQVTIQQTSSAIQGASNVTTVTIGSVVRSFTTITAKNAPAISGAPATTVAEDSLYAFQADINTTSGEITSWSITGKPSWATFNTINGSLSGTPTNDNVGVDANITITATNEIGSVDLAAFDITVTNTNDAPVATGASKTTNEDFLVDVNTTALISDVDVGDSIILTFTQGANGTVTNNSGILIYTPAPNFFGTDTFTFTATDSASAASTATVTVTVNSVNDIAILGGTIAGTIAEGATSISNVVTITDPDAGEAALQLKENVQGTYGAFNVAANGTWTYTLTDSSTIQALNVGETLSDGITDVNSSDNTATTDLNVTITGVNDAPVAASTATYSIKKGSDLNITLSATDVDNGSTIALTAASATNATVNINDVNGSITFNATTEGIYTLSYVFTDEHNATGTGTHTITVTLSDPPVANNDTAATDEDTAVSIDVVTNDTDDNVITSVAIVTGPSNGTAVVEANNTITYTPFLNHNGTDSFVYKTIDADGGFDNADVNITINAINDAPVLTLQANQSVTTDAAVTIIYAVEDVDNNISDINVTATSDIGTVIVNVGTLTYTPPSSIDSVATITVTVTDSNGSTDQNTTIVTVNHDFTTSPGGFVDPIIFYELEEDNGEPIVYKSTLSDGTITDQKLGMNANGVFDVNLTSGDYILINGIWTQFNDMNYTVTNGNIVFASGEVARISETINLSDTTISTTETTLLTELNAIIPGADINFTSGAAAYILQSVNPEIYELWFAPSDCTDWNQTTNSCNVAVTPYDTIPNYMNSNNSVSGKHDVNGTWIGIYFAKNGSGEAIDSEGNLVTSLSVDTNGSLVLQDTNATVGTWKVITLPGNAGLAIITTPNPNDIAHFEYPDENLVALNGGVVYRGERRAASATFTSDDFIPFNEIAFNDIQTAFQNYVAAQSGVETLRTLLAGKTFYTDIDGNNTLESWAFDPNAATATWTELVDIDGELCNGDVNVTINSATEFVASSTGDSCINDPLNYDPDVTITITDQSNLESDGYIIYSAYDGNETFTDNRMYINRAAAEIYFGITSSVTSGFDASTYFTGTKYFVNDSGTVGERTFDGSGNYTGVINNVNVSGTYTTSGNTLTLTRVSPSAFTIVLTNLEGLGNGEIFTVSIDGGAETFTFYYDTSTQRDYVSPATTAGNMVNGMILRDISTWNGEYELYTVTLAGTYLTETANTIDENGTFNVDINDTDLILTDVGWVSYPTYLTSNTYTLVNGNIVFADGEIARITASLNLATPTTPAEITAVAKLNEIVPGDANISFATGAVAYTMEFKSTQKYELWDMATNCSDWNATSNSCNVTPTSYDTLANFIVSGTTVAGSDVNGTWISVDVLRDTSGNPLDSNGTVFSTVSEGLYGNLYVNNTTIVGTWKVIDLPYGAGLAIVLSKNSGSESYFGDSDTNLLAVANSFVYQGEMTQLSTDFVTSDFITFNPEAFANIQTAFELFYSVP